MGTNLMPWEIDDIPGQWLLAMRIAQRLPEMQAGMAKVESIFEKAKRDHPTFRKLIH